MLNYPNRGGISDLTELFAILTKSFENISQPFVFLSFNRIWKKRRKYSPNITVILGEVADLDGDNKLASEPTAWPSEKRVELGISLSQAGVAPGQAGLARAQAPQNELTLPEACRGLRRLGDACAKRRARRVHWDSDGSQCACVGDGGGLAADSERGGQLDPE